MKVGIKGSLLKNVNEVDIPESFNKPLKVSSNLLTQFFHGGIQRGSTFTLSSDPGLGKSTFCCQLLSLLADQGYRVALVSGEETDIQIANRCKRLNITNIQVGNITDVDTIASLLAGFDLVIIDSFQSLTSHQPKNLESYIIETLLPQARETQCSLGFICHHTKDGTLKGSTLIPHSVDGNIELELSPQKGFSRRLLLRKYRFGPCVSMLLALNDKGFNFTSGYIEVTKDPLEEHQALKEKILQLECISIPQASLHFGLTAQQTYRLFKELKDEGSIVHDAKNHFIYRRTENIRDLRF